MASATIVGGAGQAGEGGRGVTGGGGAGGAGGSEPTECGTGTICALDVAIRAVRVIGEPRKGDDLVLAVELENRSAAAGTVVLRPRLTSLRFAGLADVSAGSATPRLSPGERAVVEVPVPAIFEDAATGNWFALGSGDYSVDAVTLEGAATSRDSSFPPLSFSVAAAAATLVAVVVDLDYFDSIDAPDESAATLLERAVRAPAMVLQPDPPDTNTGTLVAYPGGLEEILDVRFRSATFEGWSPAPDRLCEQLSAFARPALGIERDWDADDFSTNPEHHGFDLLLGLTPAYDGSAVTCPWLGVGLTGASEEVPPFERAVVSLGWVLGNAYGASNCNSATDTVMCGGFGHPRFQESGTLVWLDQSVAEMSHPFE